MLLVYLFSLILSVVFIILINYNIGLEKKYVRKVPMAVGVLGTIFVPFFLSVVLCFTWLWLFLKSKNLLPEKIKNIIKDKKVENFKNTYYGEDYDHMHEYN